MTAQKEFKPPKIPSQFLGKEICLLNGPLSNVVGIVEEINFAFVFVNIPQKDGSEIQVVLRRSDGTVFNTTQRQYPQYEYLQIQDHNLRVINNETMIGQNIGILYGQKEVYGRATVADITNYEILAWISKGYTPREGYARYERISGMEILPKKGQTRIDWIGMARINNIHGLPNDMDVRAGLELLDSLVNEAVKPKRLKARKKCAKTKGAANR